MTTPTTLPKPFEGHILYANIRGGLILLPWLIHLFVSDILLSLLLPFSFVFPRATYHASSYIAYLVWRGIQAIFENVNHARITRSGDKLPPGESAMIISNHVSWTDFYMIQHLAVDAGMLGRCRWFAKVQLKWVPFLGWGLWAMGMPLISRKCDKDHRELDRVFKGPKKYNLPICESTSKPTTDLLSIHVETDIRTPSTGLVSYSESTRYTPQKFLETVQWCKANHKTVPKYTLHPRTTGFGVTTKELRDGSSVKAIYDVTIAYAHGKQFFQAPSMWETITNPHLDHDYRFHVHVRRFPLYEFADMTNAELRKWLEQRWIAKGQTLEQLQMELEDGRDWADHVEIDEKKSR